MKILIVEDHSIIRIYLKTYLAEHYPNATIELIKDFNSSLLETIIKVDADVVILDISLDQQDALDFFVELKTNLPNTHFIIYTMHNISSYKRFFWNAGASAYVLKEDAQSNLTCIINSVLKGERVFPKEFETEVNDYRLNQLTFTKIERRLLKALVDNIRDDELDKVLSCTKKDVLNLRRKLLTKSGAQNTQQLINYALDYNWIR